MRSVYFDVTCTLRLAFTSGIQRVVRELARRLHGRGDDEALRFVPVVYCPGCNGWRQLSRVEYQLLLAPVASARSGVRSGPQVAALLRSVAMAVLGFRLEERVRQAVFRLLALLTHPAWHRPLQVDLFEQGSVFMDLDSAWHSPVDRSRLLPGLRKAGVPIIAFHYDLVPLLSPGLVHDRTVRLFRRYLDAHVKNSDLFVCISEYSRRELLDYCNNNYPGVEIRTSRLLLGADFGISGTGSAESPLPPDVGRYILSVGTVEPRKNHARLLDLFEKIGDEFQDVSLVLVGRQGWKSRKLARRIRCHRWLGRRLFWYENVGDAALSRLYRGASLCIVPSVSEGYGLPVAEALANGCVTISSDGGALNEAGGGLAEYFDSKNIMHAAPAIRSMLSDPECFARAKNRIPEYHVPTWDRTSEDLVNLVQAELRNRPNR